ncbi:MAG: flavodoxin [Tissierellia bacterium]|nr:flavodoxin [Tissierellia bacterium]
MKKVIFWSGTGNTEAMAEAICEALDDAELLEVGDATVDDVANADAIAFGCPSMGDEVLEESEMEPFIESIEDAVKGKPIILFGSYDWGNGEWMEDWEERMKGYGAELVAPGLIVNLEPSDEDLEACKELAKKLN